MFVPSFHPMHSVDISPNSLCPLLRRRGDNIVNSYFFYFFFGIVPGVPMLQEVSVIIEPKTFIGGDRLAEIRVGAEAPQPIKRSTRSVTIRVVVLVPGWRLRGRVGKSSTRTGGQGFGGGVSAEEAANNGEEHEHEVEKIPAVFHRTRFKDVGGERLHCRNHDEREHEREYDEEYEEGRGGA